MSDTVFERRTARPRPLENPYGDPVGRWTPAILDGEIGQVDLVVIAPRTLHGFYIHPHRDEWHLCIKGRILVAQAGRGAIPSGEDHPEAVLVPALVAHGILNATDEEAWVLTASAQAHDLGSYGLDSYPAPVSQEELAHLTRLWRDAYGKDS
jgi:quercetin dioxygenase-like cupin family protein